ncbi:MAG TPA: PQQ-dependent sugar dehydrogenase [Thermoanaerobaculia bacterium]
MRRAPIDLAILAALTLLTNLLYFAASNGDFFFPDSRTYIEPARSMLAGHGFLRANGVIETFRTPGYPLFLMAFRTFTAVVLVQHLMNVALAMAIYLFARQRLSRGIAFIAGLIFALDTPSIHYANKVLTETLFTVGLFALIWLVLRGRAANMIVMGLLTGALVLIRPASILYFAVLAIVMIRRKHVIVFVIASLILPIAWMARNKARTGVFAIADVAGINMLDHRAAPSLAIFDDYDFYEALRDRQEELASDADTEIERTLHTASAGDLNPAQHAMWFGKIGRRIALQHPLGLTTVLVRGVCVNLFDSDSEAMEMVSSVPPTLLAIVLDVWTHAITLLALFGTYLLWQRDRTLSLLVALTIAYFVLISAGSEAEARFRVPVVPIMAIAAATTLHRLYVVRRIAFATLLLSLAACGGDAQPVTTTSTGLGHHEIRLDQLPAPYATPSAANAPWTRKRPANAQLHLPPGFHIAAYATGIDDPRNMILAPNGDIIVAQSGASQISILRNSKRYTFTTQIADPFGLAIHDEWLYVGAEDGIYRMPYRAGETASRGGVQKLAPLPGGGHSTRNIVFSADGTQLFVAIGSASNISREDPPRAAIMAYDANGKNARVFAFGLRNPVGLAWNPTTHELWTSVNERDGLGDDLVPDYITGVRANAFYGWPYAYLGAHEDPRRRGERPDLVSKAVVPALLIQAHSAPLGLVFYNGTMFPPEYRGRAFVALHGSWNRSRRTGYSVISVPFRDGKPAGGYDDFVIGWMPDPASNSVWGRPVGLLVLGDGSLLVSDDGANVIWRVTYSK